MPGKSPMAGRRRAGVLIRLTHGCCNGPMMARCGGISTPSMPRKTETAPIKVVIDPTVMAIVDQLQPAGLSRTGWINYLIQEGAARIRDRNA